MYKFLFGTLSSVLYAVVNGEGFCVCVCVCVFYTACVLISEGALLEVSLYIYYTV